jgi:16S rRNA (uracil1498-N3)-methyltransferase
VPEIAAVRGLTDWLSAMPSAVDLSELRFLLSPRGERFPAIPPTAASAAVHTVISLSGPEGGLTDEEEQSARARGFQSTSLGPRILRADTAPLALLARVAMWAEEQPAQGLE